MKKPTVKNVNFNVDVLSVMGLIYIVLKLTGNIDWSWWYVTMPFWGTWVLAVIVFVVLRIYKAIKKLGSNRK